MPRITLENVGSAPDEALTDIRLGCSYLSISRASIYRLIKAGDLHIVRVGHATRLKVGELRRLAGSAL